VLEGLGAYIRKLRLARSLTIADVAARAKCDASYLGQVERGRRNPTVLLLHRIAAILETSSAALHSKD
jgi:transcriptional regulator with XRE-family HTH domain